MSVMNEEVYDAFIATGIDEQKARKAAKSLADYEGRFSKIEAELLLLKWMAGFNIALSAAILVKLFK